MLGFCELQSTLQRLHWSILWCVSGKDCHPGLPASSVLMNATTFIKKKRKNDTKDKYPSKTFVWSQKRMKSQCGVRV